MSTSPDNWASPNPILEFDEHYSQDIQEMLKFLRRYLYLPDPAPFIVTLAVTVAHKLAGKPTWLMLVGPPGCGKTEILDSLLAMKNVVEVSTLSEASLLSGSPLRERAKSATGGLLKQIGDEGVLVAKDFTTILSMDNKERAKVFAALREIYDGRWRRNFGSDGGRFEFWKGKCTFIGGVTNDIDTHHSAVSKLGERFIYYRMPEIDPEQVAATVLSRDSIPPEEVEAFRAWIAEFIDSLDLVFKFELTPLESRWLNLLARTAARGRAAVDRDGWKRDIVSVHKPELPGRIAEELKHLYSGMRIMKVSRAESKRIVRKVALDCIPYDRTRVIELLYQGKGGMKLGDMRNGDGLMLPPHVVRRAVEELECLLIASREYGARRAEGDVWNLTGEFREAWRTLMIKV